MHGKRIGKVIIGGVLGFFVVYYAAGSLIMLLTYLFLKPKTDPSLIIALVALPMAVIGGITGMVMAFRRSRAGSA